MRPHLGRSFLSQHPPYFRANTKWGKGKACQGSGSISQRYGSGTGSVSGSFLFLIKRLKLMCLWICYKNEKYEENFFFCILEVTVERSRIRIRIHLSEERYGSGDPDPYPHKNVTDPHQNFTDPQHWLELIAPFRLVRFNLSR